MHTDWDRVCLYITARVEWQQREQKNCQSARCPHVHVSPSNSQLQVLWNHNIQPIFCCSARFLDLQLASSTYHTFAPAWSKQQQRPAITQDQMPAASFTVQIVLQRWFGAFDFGYAENPPKPTRTLT
eukprot:660561-Rhodomonas_salina.1